MDDTAMTTPDHDIKPDPDPAVAMAAMDEAELMAVDPPAVVVPKEEPAEKTEDGTQAPASDQKPTTGKVIVVSEEEPVTEDEVIRRKLMFDGDGGGDDRRLNLLMKSFFTWCRTEPGPGKDLLYERILFLLEDSELCMRKALLVQQMNERELLKYESLTSELDEKIDAARIQMQHVKEDLMNAKNVRRNRMEYDPIVAKIKDLPSRKQSLQQMERIKGQTKVLSEKVQELDRRIELRKNQFQHLSSLAHELHANLNQDEALALEDLPDEVSPERPLEPPVKQEPDSQ